MSENKAQNHEGGDEEVDVIAQGAKDLKVRMYSTAVVAQQFFSKLCAAKEQADSDPDVTQRRMDCHKQLLNLRAMNVQVEHGEEDGDSMRKEEELKEWLDGIEARKAAQRGAKKKKDSKGSVKRSSTVPDRLNTVQQSNSMGNSRSRNNQATNTGTRAKAGSIITTRESGSRAMNSLRAQISDRQVDSLLRGQLDKKFSQ